MGWGKGSESGGGYCGLLCSRRLFRRSRLRTLSILPVCFVLLRTSMSLALTFAALRAAKPAAKAIVWPRMDQKSCLKAIVTAGFTPIVVENLIEVGRAHDKRFSRLQQ